MKKACLRWVWIGVAAAVGVAWTAAPLAARQASGAAAPGAGADGASARAGDASAGTRGSAAGGGIAAGGAAQGSQTPGAGPCMPGMKMPGCPDVPAQNAPGGGSPAAGPQDAGAGAPAAAAARPDSNAAALQDSGAAGLIAMRPENFLQAIVHHSASGTGVEPDSTPSPMLMTARRGWMLMFHANVFVLDEQQTGPRGGDKLFSTNWMMGMAQRPVSLFHKAPGVLTLRAMLSLEPATITGERYPLLFQQGETAYGVPIADGQHPHNLFMELAALYDLKVGERGLLSFYLAPVGDPALGPVAYPHRASAAEDPLAALGHHQEDSTHISADVVSIGLAYKVARVEASGFHGREPGEDRWTISQGAMDSWSTRFTLQPGRDWSGQFSYGRLHSPEALSPGEDQERMTASVMYNRIVDQRLGSGGDWASSLVWGRTQSLPGGVVFNSYLAESTVTFARSNRVWTRVENADRSNELLIGENLPPPGFAERRVGRVQAYTIGYDREGRWVPHLATALGAQVTWYGVPVGLRAAYGATPVGVAVFLRLRPVGE